MNADDRPSRQEARLALVAGVLARGDRKHLFRDLDPACRPLVVIEARAGPIDEYAEAHLPVSAAESCSLLALLALPLGTGLIGIARYGAHQAEPARIRDAAYRRRAGLALGLVSLLPDMVLAGERPG